MGQKTHPTGFRVGIIQPWASTWFAKVKEYGEFVAEDAKIRKFIKKKLYAAGVSKILIARKAQNTTVTVVTAKPGIVVGRGGQGIEELKTETSNAKINESRYSRYKSYGIRPFRWSRNCTFRMGKRR